MLDIDISLVYQFIGYFVLLFILNRLLYRPVQRILRERDERIGGTLKKASETEKSVEEGLKDYDRKLREAAVKGHEERARLKAQAHAREKEILEAAGAEVAKELQSMRAGISSSRAEALKSLRGETTELSRGIAEKLLDRKVVTVLLMVLIPLIPALAVASGGGDEHPGMFDKWKVINFLILAAAVYIGWKKVVNKMLDKRSVDIKQALEDARAAKEAADRKEAEYRQKLATLESSIARIAEELRLEGEDEKRRIIEEAGRAAERLKAQARATAEQELKKARLEIRKEVGELAVKMAEELLSREVGPGDQERLIRGYIQNIRLN